MANQIGTFFAAEPERSAALEGVAGHIKRFWDPRMRRQIIEMLDAGEAAGLDALVADAIRANRERLLGSQVVK